jgi:hypothetical protein
MSLPSLSLLKPRLSAETLRIESEPPGADARTSLGPSCRTPCELAVQSGGEFSVTLTLANYQPQTVSIRPEVPPPTERGTEYADARAQLAPNPVYVELEALPAAPSAKPLAKRKRKTIAASPVTPAPTTAATPAAAASPVPATAAEAAVSATNYPWPSR